MKTMTIDIPLLKASVYVVTDCSAEEYGKHLKKKWNVKDDFSWLEGATGTTLKYNGPPYRTIWIEKFRNTPDGIGTLVHEAVHCAIRICEDKGVPTVSGDYVKQINSPLDETFAYLVDYLVREIMTRYKKK